MYITSLSRRFSWSYFLTICGFLFYSLIFNDVKAQQPISVAGKVVDKSTDKGIPGVTVRVVKAIDGRDSTITGFSSDVEGRFKHSVKYPPLLNFFLAIYLIRKKL